MATATRSSHYCSTMARWRCLMAIDRWMEHVSVLALVATLGCSVRQSEGEGPSETEDWADDDWAEDEAEAATETASGETSGLPTSCEVIGHCELLEACVDALCVDVLEVPSCDPPALESIPVPSPGGRVIALDRFDLDQNGD